MKIDTNLFTQKANRMMSFFLINFHPKGEAGGLHLLRY